MAEQEQTTETTETSTEQETSPESTSAETQNTDTQDKSDGPAPVPYDRFSQVNKELKAAQKQLKALQEAEEKRKEAEMSEVEKLASQVEKANKRAEEAEAAATQLRLQQEFRSEAERLKLRFVDGAVSDAFALADLSMVEVGDDGVKGMKEAITALHKAKPYLFAKPENHDIDATAGGAGKPPENSDQKKQELRSRFNIRPF